MKNLTKIFAIVAVVLMVSVQPVWAGNDNRRGTAGATELLINPWAHSSGWGSVSVANVRGIDAFYSNIAGLAFIDNMEFAYANTIYLGGKTGLNSGASINAIGMGIRVFEAGVLGAQVMIMGFGDIDVTTVENPTPGTAGSFNPSFMNIALAYAHSFTRSIHGGGVIKIISESTDNVSASGFAIDAGIQYVTGADDELKFGISLKNIGATMSFSGTGHSLTMLNNAGNNFTVETRAAEMELPTCLNIGVSYDFLFENLNQKLSVAGSFTSNAFLKDNFALGVEYGMLNMFQVRCGYVYQSDIFSSSDRTTTNTGLCAGASVDIPLSKKDANGKAKTGITLDYSYRSASPLKGTHTIGGTFRF
ncbi:MAG: PorV/PorQ family protein [Bacteroidales bacterium]|nr:PorV/PorQ family protein [Candidatus Colimorpha onthohippi]